MTEAFLHYLWQNRLFQWIDIQTTSGEPLQIIHPGFHNEDAGPDFKQAIIQIGQIKWAGDIEIHIRSSDWYRHRHEVDEKYKSVALHVVYIYDREVLRQANEPFPTLELKKYIPQEMYVQYQSLIEAEDFLSCRYYLSELPPLHFSAVISTMAMERLLRKQNDILKLVQSCKGDWNEALYRQMAVNFGFKTNATAFELLAKSLPYKLIAKHLDSSLQVQALMFGQAGMLERPEMDDYYNKLRYEYDYLKYKYGLTPIAAYHWNLLRLRPQNFPCVRLAQFSELLYRIPNLFQMFVDNQSVDCLRCLFKIEPPAYWQTHFHFGKVTNFHKIEVGQTTWTLLLINTVIPALFAYNRFTGNEAMQEKAVAMLEQLPFEDNKLTRLFRNTPFPRVTSLDSQALIELYQYYCKSKKCLECSIGDTIIRNIRNK